MKRPFWWFAMVLAATVCMSGSQVSLMGDEQPEPGEEETATYVWPEMRVIELYIGAWKVVESHYDAEGKMVATVEGTEEVPWILDRHAIQRRYVSGTRRFVYRSSGMLTWNEVEKKYHGVWCDNSSDSGPRVVKGDWDEEAKTMTFLMETSTPGGVKVTHRVVERFLDEQRREAVTYRIDGDEATRILQVSYSRISICPKGPRRFFGG